MKETLKHKCLRTGVSLSSAKYYKKKYGLDDDSAWRHAAIRTYCKPLSFKVKCSRVGADYEKALRYRRLHMCSDEETIQWSLHPHKSFKQMCEEAGVDYRKTLDYRKKYQTSEQLTIRIMEIAQEEEQYGKDY